MIRTLRDGPLERGCDDTLQHVGVLRRAPDRDAIRVGSGEKRVRLDGEVRDHRKRVVVLDDEIGGGFVDVPPAELPLLQRVGVRQRIAGPEIRSLHERSMCVERRCDRQHRGQFLDIDANERRGVSRGVFGVCDDHRHWLAGKLRLVCREHRAIGEDGPVAGNRLRQIAGSEDAAHAGNAKRLVRPDGDDPRVRARH